jgi:hypothetical protein
MTAASHKAREQFWSWYVRSARRDGTRVSTLRRISSILIGFALLVAWYFWMAKTQQWVDRLYRRLLFERPLFVAAVVVAFGIMNLRSTALDYMAYSIYEVQHVRVPRKIFGNERELHRKYEEIFGRDVFWKAPELCVVFSLLLMFAGGLTLVFSRR